MDGSNRLRGGYVGFGNWKRGNLPVSASAFPQGNWRDDRSGGDDRGRWRLLPRLQLGLFETVDGQLPDWLHHLRWPSHAGPGRSDRREKALADNVGRLFGWRAHLI